MQLSNYFQCKNTESSDKNESVLFTERLCNLVICLMAHFKQTLMILSNHAINYFCYLFKIYYKKLFEISEIWLSKTYDLSLILNPITDHFDILAYLMKNFYRCELKKVPNTPTNKNQPKKCYKSQTIFSLFGWLYVFRTWSK